MEFILHKFLNFDIPQSCYCPVTCFERTYKLSYSTVYSGDWRTRKYASTGRIKFEYRQNHNYFLITDIPAYTSYDFLSDIAGIVGMFLGMSSLSVLELIIYLYLVMVRKVKYARLTFRRRLSIREVEPEL